MWRMDKFERRSLLVGSVSLVVIVIVVASWIAFGPQAKTSLAAVPDVSSLPGATIWDQQASSLMFGTNDPYDWSPRNVETQLAIQSSLHEAGVTLVRTFIPDNADDSTISTRIKTIERIGATCLAVLTNIDDTSFDEHVVSYLGNRCQLYEFGNEPDYTGISVAHYLAAWNATIPLLRRINPSAVFIGPVVETPLGLNKFLQNFLLGVKSSGILPDAVSFHLYACYYDTESSCLAKAGSYMSATLKVRRLVKQILGRELPVGITEWNYDPNNPPPAYGDNSSFMTKFTTIALQSMIEGGAAFACQFDAANFAGNGRLDMFNIANDRGKAQFVALAKMIRQYKNVPS